MQPTWKFVANLGDATPLVHGGLFVYVDETGVYPPEMERVELLCDDTAWEVRRVVLEPCTYINGVLSDNSFHPDRAAWFADELESVASCMGYTASDLALQFCSPDPLERAQAWRAVLDYFGWDNGDSYPLELSADEVANRYAGTGECVDLD